MPSIHTGPRNPSVQQSLILFLAIYFSHFNFYLHKVRRLLEVCVTEDLLAPRLHLAVWGLLDSTLYAMHSIQCTTEHTTQHRGLLDSTLHAMHSIQCTTQHTTQHRIRHSVCVSCDQYPSLLLLLVLSANMLRHPKVALQGGRGHLHTRYKLVP